MVAIDNWLRHHVIDHMFSLLDIVIYCVPQLGNVTANIHDSIVRIILAIILLYGC